MTQFEAIIQELELPSNEKLHHKTVRRLEANSLNHAVAKLQRMLLIGSLRPDWITMETYCCVWITELDDWGKRTDNYMQHYKYGPCWFVLPIYKKPW